MFTCPPPPFFLNQLIVWIISFPHLFNFCCCFYLLCRIICLFTCPLLLSSLSLFLTGLFPCPHLLKKVFVCLLLFFVVFYLHLVWIIYFSSSFFSSFLPTPLDYLLVYMSFTICFYKQLVWIIYLFTCPLIFSFFKNTNSLFRLFASLHAFYSLFLPTFCLDYLLFHVSFSVFFTNTLLGLLPCSHVLYYNYCLPRPCLPSSYCIVLV